MDAPTLQGGVRKGETTTQSGVGANMKRRTGWLLFVFVPHNLTTTLQQQLNYETNLQPEVAAEVGSHAP